MTKQILFVEDNPTIIENVNKYRGKEYEFTVASSYDEYLTKRYEKEWDLAVTDLFIPSGAKQDWEQQTISCYENALHKMAEYAGVSELSLLKKEFENSKRHDIDSATYPVNLVRLYLSINNDHLLFSYHDGRTGWQDFSAGEFTWQPHLNKYWGEKGLDYSVGPFGAEIYLEMYHEQNIPTIMITSDHAHHSEGSLVIGYIQQRGLLEYGELAFSNNKSKLYSDIEKPYSIEKLFEIIRASGY